MTRWVQNKSGILIPNREAGFIQPGIGLMNKKRGSGGGDPYWSNVASLMYFNGSNGSTAFTDEVSGVSWTHSGSSQISTAQAKFGGSSLLIGSTGLLYTSANIPSWTTTFTAEGWVYQPSNIVYVFMEAGGTWPNFAIINSGMQYSNGSVWIVASGQTIPANTWTHIAVSGNSGTIRLFINGVLCGSGTQAGSPVPYKFYIGQNSGGAQQSNGYIDCTRLTIGVCRYTASFTPPSTPFPNHS